MSMHGQLLIRKRGNETLDEFVVAVDQIIGPMRWTERQSSNYVDERYFSASVLALRITAAQADESEFSQYAFWLSIAPSVAGIQDKSFLDGVAEVIAHALALSGYEVLHPSDMSREGNGGTIYRPNLQPGAKATERVIVQSLE
jgi:hypothetical protein